MQDGSFNYASCFWPKQLLLPKSLCFLRRSQIIFGTVHILGLFFGQCTYWDYFLDSAHTGIIVWTVHILGLFLGQCTYWDYFWDSAHPGIWLINCQYAYFFINAVSHSCLILTWMNCYLPWWVTRFKTS